MNPVATIAPTPTITPTPAIAPAAVLAAVGSPAQAEAAPGLLFRRCQWCRAAASPVRMLCPVCGSSDLVEERSEGAGTVRRLLPLSRRGQAETMPYIIALDEGFTVQGAVAGGLPGAVPVGSRVELAVCTDQFIGFRQLGGQVAPVESHLPYRAHGGLWYATDPGVRRAG